MKDDTFLCKAPNCAGRTTFRIRSRLGDPTSFRLLKYAIKPSTRFLDSSSRSACCKSTEHRSSAKSLQLVQQKKAIYAGLAKVGQGYPASVKYSTISDALPE
jgi:hypothetical protein